MSNKQNNYSFETKLIHSGEVPDKETGAIAPVLVRSKTFAQKEFGKDGEFMYSRGNNPTRLKLQEKLADLEGGGYASVFSSGIAAESAFFLTLKPGDHVLFCQEVYGGTFRLLEHLLYRFGIDFSFVDFSTEKSIIEGVRKNTKFLFVETPTNPSLHVIDLKLVSKVSKKIGTPFVVDATFSPPCATQALSYGAKAVIHSLSKYIAGHNDVIAGAVVTKDKKLHEELQFLHRTLGAILSPDECYRTLQEIKTLQLRWNKVSGTALEIAKFLEKHPKIEKVLYPGLKSHKNHSVAKRQTKSGFGAVISFVLKKKDRQNLKKFINKNIQQGLISYGESLSSPETILAYPPLMSHASLPKEMRESLGINDGFFRLSIGFEDPKDIIRSLETSLV